MRPNCADMAGKRLLYLAILLGCGLFYIAYGQWLAWFVLMAVVLLPWFSLALSLPAMASFGIRPAGQPLLEIGGDPELWLLGSCPLPMPPFRGDLVVRRAFTGESFRYWPDTTPLTEHCGGYTVTLKKVRIFDYLGLFSLPVRKKGSLTILVRPRPVAMTLPEDLHRQIHMQWKPKAGGGFSENHELRQYHPGDSINQIHWKLSAKTGELMLREPMEPQDGLVLLTLHLRGTPEVLDRKLGRLLWLGNRLLEQELPFELRCLTGNGVLNWNIGEVSTLHKAVDSLLCQPVAEEGDLREQSFSARWYCHIGGAADEV